MEVGDYVEAINGNMLRSGACWYSEAIVMSVEPLILVSKSSDMRWSCYPSEDINVVGRAPRVEVIACARRLHDEEREKFDKEFN